MHSSISNTKALSIRSGILQTKQKKSGKGGRRNPMGCEVGGIERCMEFGDLSATGMTWYREKLCN